MKTGNGFKVLVTVGAILLVAGLIIMTVCFVRGEKVLSIGRFFSSIHFGPGDAEDTVEFSANVRDNSALFEGITAIKFETSYADITVSEGSEYSVKSNGFRDGAFTLTREGGVLVITDDEYNRGPHSWANSNYRTIDVTVPTDAVFDTLSVVLGVGDVSVNAVSITTSVEVSVGTGNLDISDIGTEEITAAAGVGDIKLRNANAADADLKSGTGNVTFEGLVTSRGVFNSGVGDITVKLVGGDYYVECSSGVGNVQAGETSSSGLGDKIRAGSSDAACRISAETGVGNVKVLLNS